MAVKTKTTSRNMGRELLERAQRMAEAGCTERAMAAKLGISRYVANKIKAGHIPVLAARSIEAAGSPQLSIARPRPSGGGHRRCPSCGALAVMPCYACQIRQLGKAE